MASLALHNQRTFQAAQHAWDNMEPPAEQDRWIDSQQGKDWLNESADALLESRDVVISFSQKLVVTAAEFIAGFGEAAADIYAYDPKNRLEWALARGGMFSGGEQYQQLARKVAEEMLLKHQDAAEKAHAWIGDI
ncbi:hypothetical protein [Azotobacter salinestris]|uniref:hypothetical protein n=1 Tax=Azotobacter salinestris TaxID=69964 RepID=UPI001266D719|nr:hypothetical protein [Azotobacter salinestris]